MDKIGKKMTKVGGVMTAALTVPVVAGFKKMVDAAGDLEQATNAVEVVFGDTADTILDFGKDSARAVGMARADFYQMATETSALLQNLDVDLNTSTNSTIMLTERASDMAAVYNTDVTTAMAAIQSGLRGMSRPLLQFGVNLDQSAINAKALEMGLAGTEGEIDDNAEAMAAMALIMEQTDNIAGHFASEAETLDGRMKRLKARLTDVSAELGEKLMPYAIDLLEWASGFIDRLDNLDSKQQKFILGLAGATAAIGPLLVGTGSIISAVSKIEDILPKVTAGVSSMGAAASTAVGPLSILLAAMTGAILIAQKARTAYRKEVDALLDTRAGVIKTTGSYEDYLDSLDEYIAHTGLRINKDGDLVDQMGNVIQQNTRLTRVQFEFNKLFGDSAEVIREAGLDAGYYADMAAMAGQETSEWSGTLEGLNFVSAGTFGSIIDLASEFADVQEEIADKQEDIDDLLSISDSGGYFDDVWYSASEAKTKIGEIKGEIQSLEDQMAESTANIVWNMAMAATDFETATAGEISNLFNLGIELGIITEDSVDDVSTSLEGMLDDLGDTGDTVIGTILSALQQINDYQIADKTFRIIGIESGAPGTSRQQTDTGGGGGTRPPKPGLPPLPGASLNALGGYDIASSATGAIYGEAGKEEAFFVPDGKTLWDVAPGSAIMRALGAENGDQIDQRRFNNQDITNNYNINAVIPKDEIVPTLDQLKVMT